MTTHVIPAVRRGSLSSQLAGLGLVRVLAEQADPAMRCRFEGSSLVVDTTVDDVATWLVDHYVPMPVLNPWNGGAGYGIGLDESKARNRALREGKPVKPERGDKPTDVLNHLVGLSWHRLEPIQENHSRIAGPAAAARLDDWDKPRLITAIRNACTDEMLPWLDAAVIALDADLLAFPPLQGTGGIDGHFDFSTNFHQRLLDVLPSDEARRERSIALARDWLDGTATEPLVKATIGQFDPGAAGTPNSSPFGAAESVVNPWVYVLMVEGSPLFASAPVRRLDSQAHGSARAAMTFMTSGSEFGTANGTAAEKSRGEVWVPRWDKPISYAAIKQLFSEGRAVWRGRTAVHSGQMYLAAASRGVSPGIAGFDRYTIAKRNGRAFSAVLVDQVETRDDDAVLVVADVEDWLDTVGRRSELPATVATALRRFGAARVGVARASSGAQQTASVRDLLVATTDVELAVGRSRRTRDEVNPRSKPRDARNLVALFKQIAWQPIVNSPEFRIAIALASVVTPPLPDAPHGRTMREILLPIDPPAGPGQRTTWRDSPVVTGLGQRDLDDVLADVTSWLVTSAHFVGGDSGAGSSALPSIHGVPAPSRGIRVPWSDLHMWARGEANAKELSLWFRALLALDWRGLTFAARTSLAGPVDPTFAVIAAFRDGLSADGGRESVRYALTAEWIAQLISGLPGRAHASAQQRLHQLGYAATAYPSTKSRPRPRYGRRLAAALLPVAATSDALRCVSHPLRRPTDTDRPESRPSEELA